MKGDAQILELLNECLSHELAAINQYFAHSKMCANWGYARLAKHKWEESLDEMKHADKLVDRILYLDGVPNMQRLSPVRVGETVEEQHRCDLELEQDAIARLNAGIALCRDKGDNGTRHLLEEMLTSEEHAVDFLEAQLQQIADMGIENYLAQQIRE